jgi:hypothetical protein
VRNDPSNVELAVFDTETSWVMPISDPTTATTAAPASPILIRRRMRRRIHRLAYHAAARQITTPATTHSRARPSEVSNDSARLRSRESAVASAGRMSSRSNEPAAR